MSGKRPLPATADSVTAVSCVNYYSECRISLTDMTRPGLSVDVSTERHHRCETSVNKTPRLGYMIWLSLIITFHGKTFPGKFVQMNFDVNTDGEYQPNSISPVDWCSARYVCNCRRDTTHQQHISLIVTLTKPLKATR